MTLLEDLLAEEELNVLHESTDLDKHKIDDFPIEDDYHCGNSSCFEDEADCGEEPDTDLDEEGEDIERYQEYKADHNKYDDMYVDVESKDVKEWTCDTNEIEVGMTWPIMSQYKLFVIRFCISNGFEVVNTKDNPTRLRCKCRGPNCPFRLFANMQGDGKTTKIIKYIANHGCVNRTGTCLNKMANSTWVASVIGTDIKKDTYSLQPSKIKSRLQVRFGVILSYWVCWKGKAKTLTKLYGSYEDGYKWSPEVMDQTTRKNRGSIGVVATDTNKDFSY